MVHKLRCLSTQQTNTLYQLLSKKILTIIMSAILREPQKKSGNIVVEFFIKENTKQLVPNKDRTSRKLT